MLTKVISGGQTGADIAGLLAAQAVGIPTGGWCPKGWKTESGPNLDLKNFGLVETPSSSYTPRTERNVADSDGTCLFCYQVTSAGSIMTANFCRDLKKPYYIPSLKTTREERARDILKWIHQYSICILNVAGNRESKARGIQKETYETLLLTFTYLQEELREDN